MSACDNMEEKAPTDVKQLGKRSLLVPLTDGEEVVQVIINIDR